MKYSFFEVMGGNIFTLNDVSASLLFSAFVVADILFLLVFLRTIIIRRLDYVSIFLFVAGVFHGILLLYVLLKKSSIPLELLIPQELDYYSPYAPLYAGTVVTFSLGVFISGHLSYKKVVLEKKGAWSRVMDAHQMKKSILIAYLLLVIALAVYWLFAQGYGGFLALFRNAQLIRSGFFEIHATQNPWSFFGKLGGISFVASFLFWGVQIAGAKQKSTLIKLASLVGLLISMCASLFVVYTWFSRSHAIAYILTFPLSWAIRKYKMRVSYKSARNLVLLAMSVLILFFGSTYLMKGARDFEALTNKIAQDAKIRLLPTFVLLDKPEYRWFLDLAYAPLYILPQRLWRHIVDYTASEIMTIKMLGARKGEGDVTGAMVIGAIPLGLLQAGVLGVTIMGLVWGFLLVALERYLLLHLSPGFGEAVYSYVAFRLVASSVWSADPQVVIYNHIDLISGLFIVVVLSRMRLGLGRSALGSQK